MLHEDFDDIARWWRGNTYPKYLLVALLTVITILVIRGFRSGEIKAEERAAREATCEVERGASLCECYVLIAADYEGSKDDSWLLKKDQPLWDRAEACTEAVALVERDKAVAEQESLKQKLFGFGPVPEVPTPEPEPTIKRKLFNWAVDKAAEKIGD